MCQMKIIKKIPTLIRFIKISLKNLPFICKDLFLQEITIISKCLQITYIGGPG